MSSRMNYAQTWQPYRQVSTQTASPGQLVLMLYDGAIRFLERAMLGFGYEDPLEYNQTISNNLLRAQSIIHELNNSLNLEAGGELASTLRRLYDYMDHRLMESNIRKCPDGIKDTIRRLTILRDAWQQMLENRASESGLANRAASSLCVCG